MICLWLLISTAFADEIVHVPAGATATAEVPSYLLPEPMFSKCLADAQTLRDLVSPGLEQCQTVCTASLREAQEALEVCKTQLDTDEDRIADLVGHNASLEARIVKLKHQRNVAWAIAGSLIAGSATAMILANTQN